MDKSNPSNKTDVPFLNDKVYRMKVYNYIGNYNENIYNLCLQHSSPDLESVLNTNSIWDNIMADQYVILVLHVIREITHKQDEKI